MVEASACVGVDEAMGVDGALACEGVCQDLQALEAEARVAIPAQHLVALRSLRVLVAKVLLGHPHAASGALPCAGLLDPLQEAVLILLLSLALLAHPCSMLLTRQALVIWLREASKAGVLFAQRAPEARYLSISQCHTHRAVRGGAGPEVGRGGDRLLQAPREEAVHELRGQELPQIALCKGGAALRARDTGSADLEASLRVLEDALRTVPSMPTAKPYGAPRLNVIAADLAGLDSAVDLHGTRA
mmetsp:Transcript_14631/g.41921  ORF Transcript_14631/g.41921 Transcript_14631/m.41921 type:complete len:245 (+) Transcript_14631:291-1025(+)